MNVGNRARRMMTLTLAYILLIVGAVIVLTPLAWMVSTSLKLPGQVFSFPPEWIPNPVIWENYREALTMVPFALFFRNSALVTGLSVLGSVVSSSVVAFSFARLRWKGRDALFLLVLATMILPNQVTLIPLFALYKSLNWLDTYLPLILPHFFAGPFFIFLLRQFYMQLPIELDDAAFIDGCSRFGVFWRITLPLSVPALAAVAIFSFQWTWTDFFGPLIFIFDKNKYTVELGLRFFQGNYGTYWHYLMAASLVAMMPVIIVFFLAQRYFIQGVVFTGLKG